MVARLNRNPALPEVTQPPRVADNVTQRALDALYESLVSLLRFLQPFSQFEKYTNLAFVASTTWSRFSTTYEAPQFKRDPFGVVRLRGSVARSGGAISVVGVLPLGYRPPRALAFPVYSSAGVSSVTVLADGSINYTGGAGAVTQLALDGITFDTENA